MENIYEHLMRNNHKLVEAVKFLNDKLKKVPHNASQETRCKRITEFQTLENLCLNDLSIELALKEPSSIEKYQRLFLDKLEMLKKMSEEYPIVGEAMREYLPRLQEFFQRNERLREVYDSYQEAFGGSK